MPNNIMNKMKGKDFAMKVKIASVVMILLLAVAYFITYIVDVSAMLGDKATWLKDTDPKHKEFNDQNKAFFVRACFGMILSGIASIMCIAIIRFTFNHKRIFYTKMVLIPAILIFISIFLIYSDTKMFYKGVHAEDAGVIRHSIKTVGNSYLGLMVPLGVFGTGFVLCIGHGIYNDYIDAKPVKK